MSPELWLGRTWGSAWKRGSCWYPLGWLTAGGEELCWAAGSVSWPLVLPWPLSLTFYCYFFSNDTWVPCHLHCNCVHNSPVPQGNTKDTMKHPHVCKGALMQRYYMLSIPNFQGFISNRGIPKPVWVPAFLECLGLELASHCVWVTKGIKTWCDHLREVRRLLAVWLFGYLLLPDSCLWSATEIYAVEWGPVYIMYTDSHLQAEACGFSCSISKQQGCVPAHALQVELCVVTSKMTTKFTKAALWSQLKKGKDVFRGIFLYLGVSLYEKTSDNST